MFAVVAARSRVTTAANSEARSRAKSGSATGARASLGRAAACCASMLSAAINSLKIVELTAIGLGAGVIGGLFGIGGGILMIPGMVVLLGAAAWKAKP